MPSLVCILRFILAFIISFRSLYIENKLSTVWEEGKEFLRGDDYSGMRVDWCLDGPYSANSTWLSKTYWIRAPVRSRRSRAKGAINRQGSATPKEGDGCSSMVEEWVWNPRRQRLLNKKREIHVNTTVKFGLHQSIAVYKKARESTECASQTKSERTLFIDVSSWSNPKLKA